MHKFRQMKSVTLPLSIYTSFPSKNVMQFIGHDVPYWSAQIWKKLLHLLLLSLLFIACVCVVGFFPVLRCNRYVPYTLWNNYPDMTQLIEKYFHFCFWTFVSIMDFLEIYSLKNFLQTLILSKLHSLSICHLLSVFCSTVTCLNWNKLPMFCMRKQDKNKDKQNSIIVICLPILCWGQTF